MKKNPYRTLGLSENCDAQDTKRAFRSLAKQYHPDRNPGDEAAAEKFREIVEAYRCLIQPDARIKTRVSGFDELSSMPRCVRVHVRRRALHQSKATRRPRRFLMMPVPKLGRWRGWVIAFIWLALILPLIANLIESTTGVVNSKIASKTAVDKVHALVLYMEAMRLRADAGEADAQFTYGNSLFVGQGIKPDKAAARVWWQRAANQGHAGAIRALSR